jgi:hypothetical protein
VVHYTEKTLWALGANGPIKVQVPVKEGVDQYEDLDQYGVMDYDRYGAETTPCIT